MRTSGDISPQERNMAPNCEVATLVAVKVRGLYTKFLVADQQHPFQASAYKVSLDIRCSRMYLPWAG
jgi:hypothetical protein